MTKLQKLQLKLSESRSAINDLQAKETRTEEETQKLSELRTAHQTVEQEYRSALEATPDPAPEVRDAAARELDRLVTRASIGNVLEATLSQRATEGPESELQAHFGLSGNMIPLEMLQERAATPAPTEVGQRQHPVIPPIFPDAVASFLGVQMPTVPVGDANYVVLTTGATVHTPAKGADAAETTGAFTAQVLNPKRAQASFFWSIEDEARLAGMESALRQNLRQALSSKFDDLLLNDATDGLLGGGLTAPSNPALVALFADYKSAVTAQVDGKYASMPDQVRLLLGSKTYAHSESVYRVQAANGGNNESGYEIMVRKSGGVRVSDHIAAPASNRQDALAARRINAMHAVMPIWRGITLIPDRITKAKSGQVVLTSVALWSLKILRSDGFSRLKFKLA